MKKIGFKKEHIPNYISVFRIALIPTYVLFFFGIWGSDWAISRLCAAGLVFLIAGFSDALDGYLARRNHWITDIGKLLDPFADKLLEVVVTVCLAIEFKGPFIILSAIIITKEIIMIVGAWLIMSKSNVYVSAVWCGKLATIVWYFLICAVHFFGDPSAEGTIAFYNALCIILILVMAMAFVMYVFNYAAQIQTTKEAIIQKVHSKKENESK